MDGLIEVLDQEDGKNCERRPWFIHWALNLLKEVHSKYVYDLALLHCIIRFIASTCNPKSNVQNSLPSPVILRPRQPKPKV